MDLGSLGEMLCCLLIPVVIAAEATPPAVAADTATIGIAIAGVVAAPTIARPAAFEVDLATGAATSVMISLE